VTVIPLDWNNSADDSGVVASNTELHWHIIESSDRWFQTHQRAVATMPDSRCANVTRWDAESVIGLPARIKQPSAKETEHFLVWEFPLGQVAPMRVIDLIATVSQHKVRPIQMVHVRPGVAMSTLLAFQEAGISLVLHDLWTLRNVMRRIQCRR
jgi:hypothetical protein